MRQVSAEGANVSSAEESATTLSVLADARGSSERHSQTRHNHGARVHPTALRATNCVDPTDPPGAGRLRRRRKVHLADGPLLKSVVPGSHDDGHV